MPLELRHRLHNAMKTAFLGRVDRDQRIFPLLSQLSTASGIGEELADSTRDRASVERLDHFNPTSRRLASLLPTSRIMSAIRLLLGCRSNQWKGCRLGSSSMRIAAELCAVNV